MNYIAKLYVGDALGETLYLQEGGAGPLISAQPSSEGIWTRYGLIPVGTEFKIVVEEVKSESKTK